MDKIRRLTIKNNNSKNGISLYDYETGEMISGVRSISLRQDVKEATICTIEFIADVKIGNGIILNINTEKKQ